MRPSLEQLRELKPSRPKEIVGRHGEVMKITRLEHICSNKSCPNKRIPKGSKAWVLKFAEDQFETTETGVKPLPGKKYDTRYTHYPDCDNPELASEQKNFF